MLNSIVDKDQILKEKEGGDRPIKREGGDEKERTEKYLHLEQTYFVGK